MLKAIGSGAEDVDMGKLAKAVKLFHDLYSYHIEEEESMIYPKAKATLNILQASNAMNWDASQKG